MEFESEFEKLERVCNLIALKLDDIKDVIFKLEHEIKGSIKYNKEEDKHGVDSSHLTSSCSTSEQITNN